jgi:hypothetical protein
MLGKQGESVKMMKKLSFDADKKNTFFAPGRLFASHKSCHPNADIINKKIKQNKYFFALHLFDWKRQFFNET